MSIIMIANFNCSRLDRSSYSWESILLYESPFHFEASCILYINVAPVVRLLFQEKSSICPFSTCFKPASEHSLDNFWSSDNCSNFRSYSCTGFPCCCSLVEFSALGRTVGISNFSKCSCGLWQFCRATSPARNGIWKKKCKNGEWVETELQGFPKFVEVWDVP